MLVQVDWKNLTLYLLLIIPLILPTVGISDMHEHRTCVGAIENCVKEAVTKQNETDIMKILTKCTGSMSDPA